MQYRTIPKTGDSISVIGFGCMRFPEKNGKIDEEKSTRQIQKAVESGVNYFDTAYPYHNGTSEAFLGKALKKTGLRPKVKIATKLPQWLVQQNSDMDRYFQQQLTRLQTEMIDYYLVHAIDGGSWERLKSLGIQEWLLKLKKEKLVQNIGFSYHGNQEDFSGIVDDMDWDFCQIQYNILDETMQAGKAGLDYAAGKNLAVMVMEPLRGGNLAGEMPTSIQRIWDESPVKRTPAEWALRWLWNHKEVTTVLSGMTEDEHLEENTRIASLAKAGELTDEELERINRVKEQFHALLKIGCTGCGYCIPCPFGIEIPRLFHLYNAYHMFEDKKFYKELYMNHHSGIMGADPSHASLCKDCGKCEKHCPQTLEIRDLLKDVEQDFENIPFRLITRFRKPLSHIIRKISIGAK